jgi:hypothetical protein
MIIYEIRKSSSNLAHIEKIKANSQRQKGDVPWIKIINKDG